ncbi:MAG: alpha/beta fold hydrolase [Microscillaceae bacterium]|nr:alpha/beta fold hydrolase [Microscillaceae bacterium]
MKKLFRFLLGLFLFLCLLVNVIACNHAYRFTHFSEDKIPRVKPEELTFKEKLNILFFGIKLPKPQIEAFPDTNYETIEIQGQKKLEGWLIEVQNHQGIVLIFHGYGGNKSEMLEEAREFNHIGYSTFLVDFRGSGGSAGYQTTIGYHESQDVKASFEYIQDRFPNDNIILYGFSMGAVAIMKSMAEDHLEARKILLGCPFGSMRKALEQRFKMFKVPTFPLADLMMVYGGFYHDFNALKHKPSEYARKIHAPTLLLYGKKDPKVSMEETEQIYNNLAGKKFLRVFEHTEHFSFLIHDREVWRQEVKAFLEN